MAQRINLDDFVKEFAHTTLQNELKKYSVAGKNAAKTIREGIVHNWFGDYNYESIDQATQYLPYTKVFDDVSAQIIIHSYVDLDAYKDKPRAEAWRTKYGGKWDAKFYVLEHLQMTRGIIGLPPKSNAYPEHGWRNPTWPAGRRNEGLKKVLFNPANWSSWSQHVAKEYNQIINK